MPGYLVPVISSASLSEISFDVKLCLKLSRSLVLGFCSRREGVLGPEDLLKCCLTEVEAEVWLLIIPEPDSTKVVLDNLVLSTSTSSVLTLNRTFPVIEEGGKACICC